MPSRDHLPLVYSCSGCSSAAQMANYLAIALDRSGLAEMSCIAGVGGDVPKLVRLAKSGRRIIGIDGCALACVRNCLARHAIEPSEYHLLSDHGVQEAVPDGFRYSGGRSGVDGDGRSVCRGRTGSSVIFPTVADEKRTT